MADLATIDDIETALGRPPANDAEEAKWGYYISSISAFINSYVTDSFELIEDDTIRYKADYYGIIELVGAPVDSVSLVADFKTGLAVASYYDGFGSISGLQPGAVVDVTYTHGWATVPEDIKFLVIDAVVSSLGLGGTGTGTLKSLTVGDVSETYSDGTGAIVVQLRQETLDKYVRVYTTYRLGGTPGFGSANDTLPLL